MTLQQLEYIVAVFFEKSFSKASEKCFVTQPTLSMQIQKLEERLGITIFDRSRHPVIPTALGSEVIAHARTVLTESKRLLQLVENAKGEVTGELRVGIIPTVAPYLIPLFLSGFLKNYPGIKLILNEMPTEQIVSQLKLDQIDAGILVTPLQDVQIKETPLYYEPFVAYVSPKSAIYRKENLSPQEMDLSEIWLLSEGHCMQSQVINLCYERSRQALTPNFEYKAGSLETLRKMVELNDGATLLPALALVDLNEDQKKMVKRFDSPEPVREVSLVSHRNFVKKALIHALAESIKKEVPAEMLKKDKKSVVGIKI